MSALLLLCLVLVHPASADPALTRFEPAIRAFEAADRAHPPPHHATVFVGSSSFAKWTTMEETFKDLPAINRGFGGSTLPEVTHYLDRIVIPYQPSRVVVYAGTNDLADGKSGEQVDADFRTLAHALRTSLPQADIYFISISIAPSRLRWQAQFDTANELIVRDIKQDPKLHFIDVRPVMLDARGHLRRDLFGFDRLHMTAAGYALWVPIIRQALAKKP